MILEYTHNMSKSLKKLGMVHDGLSFSLKLKANTTKNSFRKDLMKQFSKSTQLVNHRNNPLIST